MIDFSTLNPYESLEAVVGDDPQDLIRQLKLIRTPIKIVAIVGLGTKQVAYIMGDIRQSEIKRSKNKGVK